MRAASRAAAALTAVRSMCTSRTVKACVSPRTAWARAGAAASSRPSNITTAAAAGRRQPIEPSESLARLKIMAPGAAGRVVMACPVPLQSVADQVCCRSVRSTTWHGAAIPSNRYRDAGVDIDAGEALVEAIKPLAKATRRSGADAQLGGFGALFDLKAAGFRDPILVATTDGVGTKLKVAIEAGKHDTVGIDLVAMCVNDLVVQGAEPLFFLDYFATGKLDVAAAKTIIAGIAQGCAEAGCA